MRLTRWQPTQCFDVIMAQLSGGGSMAQTLSSTEELANDIESLLYQTYQDNYKGLLHYIKGFVYDEQDALDLLQDVFCIAYDFLQRKTLEKSHLKAWLYRIARNHSLNFKSKGMVAERYLVRAQKTQKTSTSFEERLLEDIMVEEIVSYIDHDFSEKESEAFKLRYFYSMKLDEINEIVGSSVSTLSRMLNRCEEKIRKKFGEEFSNEKMAKLLVII